MFYKNHHRMTSKPQSYVKVTEYKNQLTTLMIRLYKQCALKATTGVPLKSTFFYIF